MDFFVTFGFGTPYRNHYTLIEAPDEKRARDVAFHWYGRQWAFIYKADDPKAGLEAQKAKGYLEGGERDYFEWHVGIPDATETLNKLEAR